MDLSKIITFTAVFSTLCLGGCVERKLPKDATRFISKDTLLAAELSPQTGVIKWAENHLKTHMGEEVPPVIKYIATLDEDGWRGRIVRNVISGGALIVVDGPRTLPDSLQTIVTGGERGRAEAAKLEASNDWFIGLRLGKKVGAYDLGEIIRLAGDYRLKGSVEGRRDGVWLLFGNKAKVEGGGKIGDNEKRLLVAAAGGWNAKTDFWAFVRPAEQGWEDDDVMAVPTFVKGSKTVGETLKDGRRALSEFTRTDFPFLVGVTRNIGGGVDLKCFVDIASSPFSKTLTLENRKQHVPSGRGVHLGFGVAVPGFNTAAEGEKEVSRMVSDIVQGGCLQKCIPEVQKLDREEAEKSIENRVAQFKFGTKARLEGLFRHIGTELRGAVGELSGGKPMDLLWLDVFDGEGLKKKVGEGIEFISEQCGVAVGDIAVEVPNRRNDVLVFTPAKKGKGEAFAGIIEGKQKTTCFIGTGGKADEDIRELSFDTTEPCVAYGVANLGGMAAKLGKANADLGRAAEWLGTVTAVVRTLGGDVISAEVRSRPCLQFYLKAVGGGE